MLAGSGCYSRLIGTDVSQIIDYDLKHLVEEAFARRHHEFSPQRSVLYINTLSGREVVVVLEAARHLSNTDRALVEIFCSRLSIAFDNVILYEQLQRANTRLEERVAARTQDLTTANRRLAAQWARLRQANTFKSEILGTVAHDLKNPLGVILGRTEILKEMIAGAGALDQNVQAQIANIRDAANRLTEMVDDLVADAMADALDITIRREPVDIAVLVQEVAEANRPLAARKDQTITVIAPPDHAAVCDSDRIREAIDNLVSNAIKYSPIGGAIDLLVAQEDGGILVAGQGPRGGSFAGRYLPTVRPLPAAFGEADRRGDFDRPRPFDRQAHCRSARRADHGRKRRPGTGRDVQNDVAGDMSQAPHIVVVDDEQPAREMVGDYLRMHGFSVSLCDGGASLRKTIAQQVPDLIVLDLNMPEEDGLSIIRDLKQRMSVPIIMLTATASAIDRVVGLELGADDYLAKPCELRELLARIRSVLRRSGAGPQPAAQPAAGPQPAAPDRTRVRFGTKWLDHDAQALRDDQGNEHPLTASEYGLLKVFAANPKRVLSRDRLLELANARDAEAFDRAIDLRIMRIRRKIEPDPARPSVIRTVRGGGYLFSPTGETSSLD